MISAPILPLAPTRFSTKNCWPSRRPSFWPRTRATTSAVLAGGNGTIRRTGRVGHAGSVAAGCAKAELTASADAASARARRFTARFSCYDFLGQAREHVGDVVERIEPRLCRDMGRQYHVLEAQELVVAAA